MIRGKENLIEWVKSTPNVKQIQIRTSPGADAFQFQSEEGENKKTMEDRLSRTLEYLEPGKYYIEMSDGNSRRNWYRDYFVLEDDVTSVSSQTGAVNIGGSGPENRRGTRRPKERVPYRRARIEGKRIRRRIRGTGKPFAVRDRPCSPLSSGYPRKVLRPSGHAGRRCRNFAAYPGSRPGIEYRRQLPDIADCRTAGSHRTRLSKSVGKTV